LKVICPALVTCIKKYVLQGEDGVLGIEEKSENLKFWLQRIVVVEGERQYATFFLQNTVLGRGI
jgi:hypothetical protein